MEINILIKYEDGIYTEMSKVFDANRPDPVPGLNAFFITFYYDDKIYSKQLVNEYLHSKGLTELIGYFMSTSSKVRSTPDTSNTPRFRIAIQSLLAAIKYPDWQNVHYLLKYLTGGFKSRCYELQTVPEELKITTGYKVLCHSENDINFMFGKKDVHIPQLANFIN